MNNESCPLCVAISADGFLAEFWNPAAGAHSYTGKVATRHTFMWCSTANKIVIGC